ncbi:SOS response-associated peptidase [bacterium]|nr:MAG: SOS response-associated peptidase [bacterium]
MCSNYRPVTRSDWLFEHWGVHRPEGEFPLDCYPSYLAPFIRLKKDGEREVRDGQFGIVPHWAKEVALGKRAYNARSETVKEKPMFRDAWKWGQRCLIPTHFFYEPNYETGKHVSWRIGLKGWTPFAIAGLWGHWRDKETGEDILSFTMLTVNADDHHLMKRFHKPGDEKRMVVILRKEDEDLWLKGSLDDAWGLVKPYPAELMDALPRGMEPGAQLF